MDTRWAAAALVAIAAPLWAAGAGGWKKATEKDRLTLQESTFVRGYSGAGQGLRNFDVLKVGGQFEVRFVVMQSPQTVIEHHGNTSVIVEPAPLGHELSWVVNGKAPHTVSPDLSIAPTYAGTADYQATWPVGCEELRELALGRTLRIVTQAGWEGQFDLPGLVTYLEKVYGITQQSLISRTADICKAAAP